MRARGAPLQRIWTAVRVLRVFDLPMLAMAASAAEHAVERYVKQLVVSEHVVLASAGDPAKGEPAAFRLARNTGPRAPYWRGGGIHDPNQRPTFMTKAESMRQRIWSAVRSLETFDIPALASKSGAHETTAADYVRQLARSGHVGLASSANGQSGSRNTYRLTRNSGPTAPVFLETTMFDPNTGRSWPTPPRREVRRRKPAAQAIRRPEGQESAA